MNKKYQPISCGFYDILTLHAMHQDHLEIHCIGYTTSNQIQFYQGIIRDIYTKDGEEFLKLGEGFTIRLDQIRKVEKLFSL